MESILPGINAAPNIHPVFVHFPIALWLAALLFWLLAVVRRDDDVWRFGRWLLYLGTLGALAAVASGYLATEAMGHDAPGHDLVHVHRDIMLVASGLAALTAGAAFAWRHSASAKVRWGQLALLLATVVVMTLGADRGAELVFRHGIGTAGDQPAASAPHDHDQGEEAHDDAAPRSPSNPVRAQPLGAAANEAPSG